MSKAKAPPKYNTIVCNTKGQWTKLVLTNAQKMRIINGMNSRPLELNGIRYYVVNGAIAGRN